MLSIKRMIGRRPVSRVLLVIALSLLVTLSLAQDSQPVIENAHADLEPFTSVIENPTLGGEPTLISVNGRDIEVPPNWFFSTAPQVAGLPPYVSRYEDPGYRFTWSWVNGEAGFSQNGIQLYGNQRYVVQVDYETALRYSGPDMPFVPSDFQVKGRLYTAQGGATDLPPQSMNGLDETHSIEWVLESTENPLPYTRLEVLFDVRWPTFVGNVFLKRVDVQTAPADYKPDFVIAFD
jgi:hypothetical protein